jgi:putative integral membrane protein (TIGR02587 family)
MEVWWAGYTSQPYDLIIIVVVTFMLLLGYNRYSGMHPGVTFKNVAIDSIEEMGIGLIISFLVLLMLNRIQLFEGSIDEIMGKVIIEAMAVSIGVSIGTAQLGTSKKEEDEKRKEGQKEQSLSEAEKQGIDRRSGKMAIAILALCGSILMGGNVAPTEEVVMLAVEAKPHHILIMAIASLLFSMVVTFFSDFKGTGRAGKKSMAYNITFDTCLCYLIALIASAFVLWYFGRFENLSFWNIVAQCIVLGVISSLGASAGRLLIK